MVTISSVSLAVNAVAKPMSEIASPPDLRRDGLAMTLSTKIEYYPCLFLLLYTLSYNLVTVKNKRSRIDRESNTVAAMIRLYCGKHHSCDALCPECTELLDYARARLDKCPYQEGKTTCVKCPVHCFKPDMRERIRAVMRYSGPRMLYRHPIMAILHLIDGRRKEPVTLTTER